jgi:hypothetical protein
MESNQLAVREHEGSNNLFIAPVANLNQAIQRYQDMKDFISGVLRKDVDFGIIPGTSKPTLLKPGAEKLATFFGLSTQFEIIEKIEDWSGIDHEGEPFFNYWYKCRITRNGKLIAEGEGSCNSFEKKFRYRSSTIKCPKCGKETIIKGKEEFGGGWICFIKKGGCGAKYKAGDPAIESQPRGLIKNTDSADLVNTLQKMAQKRAYIAAVLLAVNGSEYFTQDLEDFDYIDGVIVNVETKPEQKEKQDSLVNEAQKMGGKVTASMTLDSAEAVTNSKGVRYGDLESETLAGMINGIDKGLKKTDISEEKREEYLLKKDAIKTILLSRVEEESEDL